jgi:hypothetical protein
MMDATCDGDEAAGIVRALQLRRVDRHVTTSVSDLN